MCFDYSYVHASTVPGHPCVRLGSRVRRVLELKFKGRGHLGSRHLLFYLCLCTFIYALSYFPLEGSEHGFEL